MPTVIDSLFVELGIDASKFTKGQKEAIASFKKASEEARTRSKEIEASGQRASQFFSRLRTEAISLFGALAGANGIKDFVVGVTNSDAALGRLSRNIGVSVPTISRWQGVARIAGGSAEQMAASFTSLSDTFAGWKIGIVSPLVADLRAISTAGGTIIDVNKGVEQSFLDLSANLQRIHAQDPARAGLLGRRLGVDPALFDILIRGPTAVKAMLAEVQKLGVVTEESANAAGHLQESWNKAAIAVERAGRAFYPAATGALDFVTGNLTEKAAGQGHDQAVTGFFSGLWNLINGGSAPATAALGRTGGVPIKPGANAGGEASLGVLALARSLGTDIPGLQRITALNDAYHKGTSSKHNEGLALDFTLRDASQSAAVAAKIRAKLQALGVAAQVIDEYTNPSARSTGGHIHVGFANAVAAQRYADITRAAAGSNIDNSRASTSVSETKIGTVVINTKATDGVGVAKDFTAAMRVRQGFSSLANDGQQ